MGRGIKFSLVLLIINVLANPVKMAAITEPNVWRVSKELEYGYHQYYDVPAWNCNGSMLLLRGKNREAYVSTVLSGQPQELPIRIKPHGYLQWDRKNPALLYFVVASTKPEATTSLYRYNFNTGNYRELLTLSGKLALAPAHPDGDHLLLHPAVGGNDSARIYSLGTGELLTLELPGPVHRVRFSKDPNLSVFCNIETKKFGEPRHSRTSWIIDPISKTAKMINKGKASHPDWQPGGELISYFEDDGLKILNIEGEMVRFIPKIEGHQSWAEDSVHIVADIYNSEKLNYHGMIIIINRLDGVIRPILKHGSTYGESQSTHAHPVFSPDGTKVVYNTTNFGRTAPQALVVQVAKPAKVTNFNLIRLNGEDRLNWKIASGKEIDQYQLYQVDLTNNRIKIAELDRNISYFNHPAPGSIKGYLIIAKEYSGLESEPVFVEIKFCNQIK